MRKMESSKPTAYADIHRAGRGLREGRPAFARSIGTRANLQARSPFDVSDQALAFAMTSGARGAGLNQQIASQLSGSRRKHDQESAPVEWCGSGRLHRTIKALDSTCKAKEQGTIQGCAFHGRALLVMFAPRP